MPRHVKSQFQSPILADLTRQLMFAPPEGRLRQLRRIEQLHDQIDPQGQYPAEFLIYRITGYRSETREPALLAGTPVVADLRLMIDALSRSMSIPVTDQEPVEAPQQLAQRLGVSVKTLARWRVLGLRWRWVKHPQQRYKSLVYPRAAVDHFLARYADRVQRAAQFTQIDPQTRDHLLSRARRIAQAQQVTLNRVAAHLARKTGRALETLRQLLEKYDRDHPDDPIFTDRTGPLGRHEKRVIARARRMGVSVTKIARRFNRTRQWIYHVIDAEHAARLARLTITCSVLPTFSRPDAEAVFLARELDDLAPRGVEAAPKRAGVPARGLVDDLPEELRTLYHQPLLPVERQHSLLVRMNFLKYRAREIRDQLNRRQPAARDIEHIDELLAQAARMRAEMVQASLPAVLAAARRHLIDQPKPEGHQLLRLLESGNLVLIEAVDSYDISRKGTFEGFLNWALMRRWASAGSLPAGTSAGAAAPGGSPPVDKDAQRARRREQPNQVLGRMIDAAGESGIDLHLEKE